MLKIDDIKSECICNYFPFLIYFFLFKWNGMLLLLPKETFRFQDKRPSLVIHDIWLCIIFSFSTHAYIMVSWIWIQLFYLVVFIHIFVVLPVLCTVRRIINTSNFPIVRTLFFAFINTTFQTVHWQTYFEIQWIKYIQG